MTLADDFARVRRGLQDLDCAASPKDLAALRRIEEQYEGAKQAAGAEAQLANEYHAEMERLQEQLEAALRVVEAARVPASWISREGSLIADRDMQEGWKPMFAPLTESLTDYDASYPAKSPCPKCGSGPCVGGPTMGEGPCPYFPATMHPDEADGLEPSETVADPATEPRDG